jgi:hypothetical protein
LAATIRSPEISADAETSRIGYFLEQDVSTVGPPTETLGGAGRTLPATVLSHSTSQILWLSAKCSASPRGSTIPFTLLVSVVEVFQHELLAVGEAERKIA